MSALYDTIGLNYAALRKPDPRIAAAIRTAIGDAVSVLNVGAGTGSYEPADLPVTAVEPSIAMIRKRSSTGPRAVQARAERLPFKDGAFDAAMAILSIHHWADKEAGLHEMQRVARGRVILLTYDPAARPWLTDYLPELAALDARQMPSMADYEHWLGTVQVSPVPIPHDCQDGFLYAYWRRPEAYLDARIRSGSSSFWAIGDVGPQLEALRADLETGAWARRYSKVRQLEAYDAGYRLVVAG